MNKKETYLHRPVSYKRLTKTNIKLLYSSKLSVNVSILNSFSDISL